jgi:hypothetical protein
MKSIHAIAVALCTESVAASVTVFTNPQQWHAAAGPHTALTFVEHRSFTTITNQYANLGVTFTDGNDFVFVTPSFPSDNHGLMSIDGSGNLGTIHISFDAPQFWFALDFTGNMRVQLYSRSQLVFETNTYSAGFTPFVGLVSSDSFDGAIVFDPDDDIITVDNIYVGPPIPAPGALALLNIGALALTGKRRRR